MGTNITISVVCATKNGASFLPRAMQSIMQQTRLPDEIVCVDDASTDDTKRILQHIKDHFSHIPITIISNSVSVGPGMARHQGILEARGTYIALIDDDDWWIDTQKLALQSDFLTSHPSYAVVGSEKTDLYNDEGSYIKTYGNPLKDADIRNVLLRKNCFTTSSVLMRKDAYLAAGGFRPLFLAEDYALWLKLGTMYQFANVPNSTVAYTVRKGSISKLRRKDMLRAINTLIREYKHDYPNFWLGQLKSYGRFLLLFLKYGRQ